MTKHIQPQPVPKSHRDLIERPVVAALGTTLSNDTPQVTPVWFNTDADGYFYFNTAKGRVKEKALANKPYVALLIVDPTNPYRYLAIRGPIVEASPAEGRAHINALSQRYTGNPTYKSGTPDEQRIRYKVSPQFVSVMG